MPYILSIKDEELPSKEVDTSKQEGSITSIASADDKEDATADKEDVTDKDDDETDDIPGSNEAENLLNDNKV